MDIKQRTALIRTLRLEAKQVRDQDTYESTWGERDPRPFGSPSWRESRMSPAARRKIKRTRRASERRYSGWSPSEMRAYRDELYMSKPVSRR